MILETGAKGGQIDRRDVGDKKRRMRITHARRNRIGKQAGCKRHMQRVGRMGERNFLPREPGRAHIDGDTPVFVARRGKGTGDRLDTQIAAVLFAHDEVGHAARAVAARTRLAAVGIQKPEKHVGRWIGCLLQHDQLVEAHAFVAVSDGAHARGVEIERLLARIDHDKIVAQPMHLQKRQRFHGRDIGPELAPCLLPQFSNITRTNVQGSATIYMCRTVGPSAA